MWDCVHVESGPHGSGSALLFAIGVDIGSEELARDRISESPGGIFRSRMGCRPGTP